MNSHELRRNPRRTSMIRRLADRRSVPYAFGSAEWVKNIKNSYLAWPKFDRREANRRRDERRRDERRMPDRRPKQHAEQTLSGQKYSRILLTQEEIRLIESLYRDEVE